MSLRRKVFVINALEADGANFLVDTGLSNSPAPMGQNAVVDASGNILFDYNQAGSKVSAIDSHAEVAQVVKMALGTLLVNQKYTVVREVNPIYMAGRDANFYTNTKRYSYTTPATIADQATEKLAMLTALVTKINNDSSNYATATATDANTSLTITESGNYGLVPSNPGPAFWMMTGYATEITHTLTSGTIAVGNGNVMLYNKAVWTKDGMWLESGDVVYNFDNVLPTSAKTYTTFIFQTKYGMQDHGGRVPNLTDEIILYADDSDEAKLQALKTAMGVAWTTTTTTTTTTTSTTTTTTTTTETTTTTTTTSTTSTSTTTTTTSGT